MDIGAMVTVGYVGDITDVKRKVKLIQRLNANMAKKLGTDFTKGTEIVSRQLTKISESVKPIKLASGKETNEIRTFTTVLKQANGQLQTVTQKTVGAGKNFKVLNTKVKAGASGMRTFSQNLKSLVSRALLTIPVWFALRQGIGSVFRTIKEGLTAIVDFDRALQKAKRNLQGTAQDIEKNFGILRKEVTKLSLETGKSVEDITNAFQKFATVGFDFETSMAGANSATKLSILLFGDANETATAFARTMRVLVDTSKDAKPASEQIAEAMALTAELWKTNAFELNEMNGALGRFAPVAKTANISMEESIKLTAALSTASLRNTRAGRLLGTSFARLVTKTDELAKSLGVKVNPEVDRTYDVFLRVLDALEKTRGEAGKISPEFEKITKSIFGLRSSQAVKGLLALRQNLQKVLNTTGDVSKFNKDFEDVNDEIFQLVAQFKNLNRETKKAFVSGLVGGKEFQDTLKTINMLLSFTQKNATKLGEILSSYAAILGIPRRTLSLYRDFLAKANDELIDLLAFDITGKVKYDEKSFSKVIKGLQGSLKKTDLTQLIIDIQENKVKIPENSKQAILGQLRKTLHGAKIQLDLDYQIDGVDISIEDQNKLIQSLIDDQLKRLKIAGATESQILKIKDALLKEYDINDNIVAQKQRQLDIERSITQEQKERISFGSESVKLAEIAKNEGIQTAVAIGEVLNGQRDFNIFLRQGGERAEILKKTFADFVKNKELEQFFKGERVLSQPGLRGGERIPIQEMARRDFTAIRAKGDFTAIRAKVDFELKSSQIGLKDSTDNLTGATNNLTTAVQRAYASATVEKPVTPTALFHAQNIDAIARLSNLSRESTILQQQAPRGSSQIELTIALDTRKFDLVGTHEQLKSMVNDLVALPEFTNAMKDQVLNSLNIMADNPSAPEGKAGTKLVYGR